MKVIDLLKLIANRQELPAKVFYCFRWYELDDFRHYMHEVTHNSYIDLFDESQNVELDDFLNDEVYVELNDKKDEKIKKIESHVVGCSTVDQTNVEDLVQTLFRQQHQVITRLNEVIDKINKIEEK